MDHISGKTRPTYYKERSIYKNRKEKKPKYGTFSFSIAVGLAKVKNISLEI